MRSIFTLLLLGLSFAFILPVGRRKEAFAGKVRFPAWAGQFYPESKEELSTEIRGFLGHAASADFNADIVGLWVPHAGYMFSGQTAAHAYKLVEGKQYDAVVLIGPSHYTYLDGAAFGGYDVFRTPLGDVPVDVEWTKKLESATPYIKSVPVAHKEEHSVEVQVPFVQTVLPNTPIVPMVIGSVSYARAGTIAKAIARVAEGKRVLLVASSDMSHFPSAENARTVDSEVLKAVGAYDARKVNDMNDTMLRKRIPNLDCALCGSSALVTVMLAAKEMGANAVEVLPYTNSGEISGDKLRVVGYGAAVFYKRSGSGSGETAKASSENPGVDAGSALEDIPFSKAEKQKLFRIAREGILAALKNETLPESGATEPNLRVKRGVFVTLTNRGRLRGCIGHFGQDYPLDEIVQQMAVAAATQDYRFMGDPVTVPEMKQIDIKISVLSDLKRIRSIDEIVIGKHGIWVKQGGRSGTYLPEVATELGWNREEFLSHCSAEKAGLPADAWKKGAEIYIYSSQILSGKEE